MIRQPDLFRGDGVPAIAGRCRRKPVDRSCCGDCTTKSIDIVDYSVSHESESLDNGYQPWAFDSGHEAEKELNVKFTGKSLG